MRDVNTVWHSFRLTEHTRQHTLSVYVCLCSPKETGAAFLTRAQDILDLNGYKKQGHRQGDPAFQIDKIRSLLNGDRIIQCRLKVSILQG